MYKTYQPSATETKRFQRWENHGYFASGGEGERLPPAMRRSLSKGESGRDGL